MTPEDKEMTMTREKKAKVKSPADENEKVITGVFEGGGVRGIGLIGAAGVFLEKGYRFNRVAGNSAGSIVASLIASGYSANELRQIMMALDYSRFADKDWKDKLPFGMAYSLFAEKGIYEGKYLRDFIKEKLEKAPYPIRTFRDVKEKDGSYRLQMIAADISRAKLLVLPQDIADYGIDPDDLEVADAVRMSVSIPYFFEPVCLRHNDGTDCYIVDGGIVCNFPVWIYDDDIEAGNPPVGFCLVDDGETRPIHGVVSMFAAILETMLEARDKRYIADEKLTTVQIPTLGIQTCDFHLSRDRQEALYLAGRKAAVRYLDVMAAGAGSRSAASKKLQMRSPESRRLQSILKKPAKKQSIRKRTTPPKGIYDSLIQKDTADICPGIDWQLIKCQVNQESSFNPCAVSSCGAIGLLQLLPATAEELGFIKDELYVPERNLRAGITYLYRQYYRFPEIPNPVERVKFALASYNGGRGYINAALSLARKSSGPWREWNYTKAFLAHPGCRVNGKRPDYGQIIGYVDRIWRSYTALPARNEQVITAEKIKRPGR
jgi:NTE family protein